MSERIQYEVDEGLRNVYQVEMIVTFVGPLGEESDRKLPRAVSNAGWEAVEAAKAGLERAGFTLAHASHGTKRYRP